MSNSGVLKQVLAAVACNILIVAHGGISTWAAPNFSLFLSDQTPLASGPLNMSEVSMIAASVAFGALFGTLVYSIIIDKFSRKFLLFTIAIVQIISWLLIQMASSAHYIYAARIVGGFVGSGCSVVIPVFVSEIADDKIRGTLGSLLTLMCSAGNLFGFLFAAYFDYYTQIKIHITLPILFLLTSRFYPETPEYLLKINQIEAAEKSRNFYRGVKGVSVEMKEMKDVPHAEKAYEKIEQESTSLSLSDFCTPAAKKATIIVIFFGGLNQLCGTFAMLNYTTQIFEDAGSTLSANTSSIIVASAQLLANVLTMALVDRAGRKILVILSALGCAFGLISMGLYDIYKLSLDDYKWIPIASFSTIILTGSVGVVPLTYVIISEVLPKKIKNVVTLFGLEMMWGLAFLLILFYPALTAAFGMYSCMFLFAACCIGGVFFVLAYLPETKGKSYEEIMKDLEN